MFMIMYTIKILLQSLMGHHCHSPLVYWVFTSSKQYMKHIKSNVHIGPLQLSNHLFAICKYTVTMKLNLGIMRESVVTRRGILDY